MTSKLHLVTYFELLGAESEVNAPALGGARSDPCVQLLLCGDLNKNVIYELHSLYDFVSSVAEDVFIWFLP